MVPHPTPARELRPLSGAVPLATPPPTVGDYILLASAGSDPNPNTTVVKGIHVDSTVLVSWNGEESTVMNHQLRKMSIVNLTRSAKPLVVMDLQVPSSITPEELNGVLVALNRYLSQSEDWTAFSVAVKEASYDHGRLTLSLVLTSVYRRVEEVRGATNLRAVGRRRGKKGGMWWDQLAPGGGHLTPAWPPAGGRFRLQGAVDMAKSRILVFVHALLKSSGHILDKPAQPIYEMPSRGSADREALPRLQAAKRLGPGVSGS